MKISLALVTCAFFITSCSKTDNNGNNNTLNASSQLNVSYGTDTRQKMDVYLPANRTTASTPMMIMIHGGAWSSGDKNDFLAFVDTLKRRFPTYAIANINYRLFDGMNNRFPTQENDVNTAVNFIYSKRAEWNVSDKFVLLGASAGAHLALLQAYKNQTTIKPKAVVDFFGPTDMADMYNNPASVFVSPAEIASLVGGTPTSAATMYFQSSPINFASSLYAMPTIILHGGLDPLVKPSQSTALKDKLNTAGIVNQFVFYPTGGHGDWDPATFTDAFNKIQVFINANMH